MNERLTWLVGKKTYILAYVILASTIFLLLVGKLNTSTALTLLLLAAAGFPATFRAALARHQEEELALLTGLALLAKDAVMRNVPSLAVDIAHETASALVLGGEIQAETTAPEAKS